MELNLKGRSVLVTGSSKGIGFAVAQGYAAEGCNLCLVSRSSAALDKAAAAIRQKFPVDVRVFAADLSDDAARKRLAEAYPDIDILVNNAGAIPGGSLDEVDDSAWRAGWELKVFGYVNLTRAYLARMKARKRGVIINIIGVGGERLDFNYIAGGAGNAALMAFTRTIGSTSPSFGVRVIGINPGPVETDRIVTLAKLKAKRAHGDETRWRESYAAMPFGRPATADEIAAMAVFLGSDRSAYTSGTIISIDGGVTHRAELA